MGTALPAQANIFSVATDVRSHSQVYQALDQFALCGVQWVFMCEVSSEHCKDLQIPNAYEAAMTDSFVFLVKKGRWRIQTSTGRRVWPENDDQYHHWRKYQEVPASM